MLNLQVHIDADNIQPDFYKKIPKKYPISLNALKPRVKYENLNALQKKLIDEFKLHINQSQSEILDNQKLVLINGKGGSGKSEIARHMRFLLEKRKLQTPWFKYFVGSYTGIASTQLCGNTLHSLLKIPTYIEPYGLASYLAKPMNEKLKKALQEITVLLIDEYSLIGCRMLHFLSETFKKADESRGHLPFGGRSVILCGDGLQMKPVKDQSLVAEDFSKALDQNILESARALFHRFTEVYIMESQFRQHAESQAEFRGFLERMRYGKCNANDERLLQSRMRKNLSVEEASSFNDTLCVYQTVAEVCERNRKELYARFNNEEIITIPNGPEELTFAIGCKVGLVRNLSTTYHLVNGSIGTVVAVLRDEKSSKIKCILVKFENYRGPVVVTKQCNGTRVTGMPVYAMKQEIMEKGRLKTFIAFPLCLRYAITSYRVQSLTLRKVAIKFGWRQILSGSDYVVCSRTKSLSGLLVEDEELAAGRIRYNTMRDEKFFRLNEEEEERLRLLAKKSLLIL